MLFLKIENTGVAPYEGFVIFGATTTRYSKHPLSIGTFGSGGKLAIITLLRNNINPQIFCGLTKLSYFTKPLTIGTTSHKQVCLSMRGTIEGSQISKTKECDYTTAYGTADWTVPLALREFVSNAIDSQLAHTQDFVGVNIEIVDESKVRAKEGTTRVFIPVTPEVQEFYNNIGKWFLHFSEADNVRKGVQILHKKCRNMKGTQQAVIYRRGVYVREFESSATPSLFDYNLDIKLNEARTFNDWEAKYSAGKALRNAPNFILTTVFSAIVRGDEFWEASFDSDCLIPNSWDADATTEFNKSRQESWTSAANVVLGDSGVICENMPIVHDMIKRKGYQPVSIKSSAWIEAAKTNGVKTTDSVLTSDDKIGRQFAPSTTAVDEVAKVVWDYLNKLGFTYGKSEPQLGTFTEPLECGAKAIGLYRPEVKTAYANTEYANTADEKLVTIMVEELVHHISGATDFSRDFQTLLVQIIARNIFQNNLTPKNNIL